MSFNYEKFLNAPMTITLVTLVVGSFLINGVIESHKTDQGIKIKKLEEYYIPAKEKAYDCLRKQAIQIEKINKQYVGLELLINEIGVLVKNPDIEKNENYKVIAEALLKTVSTSQAEAEKAAKEAEQCQVDIEAKLEKLSIATGDLSFYNKENKIRNKELIKVDASFKKTREIAIREMEKSYALLREVVLSGEDVDRNKLYEKVKEQMAVYRNVIDNQNRILEKTKKINNDFYHEIANSSAETISKSFEVGFFSKILSL